MYKINKKTIVKCKILITMYFDTPKLMIIGPVADSKEYRILSFLEVSQQMAKTFFSKLLVFGICGTVFDFLVPFLCFLVLFFHLRVNLLSFE